MYYDEIDQYIDRFFREKEEASTAEVLYGDVIDSDWLVDQFDQLVQDPHPQDQRWQQFWNSPVSSHANLMQNLSPGFSENPEQSRAPWQPVMDASVENSDMWNGIDWKYYTSEVKFYNGVKQRALTCAELGILGGIGLLMILLLMVIT